MMKQAICLCIFLILPLVVFSKEIQETDNTYPGKLRLFHVERSKNRNIVCYDVNLNHQSINSADPVLVYWINREEHPGQKNGLSFIQQRLAFGYKIKSKKSNDIRIALNATNKRDIQILEKDQVFYCKVEINQQEAILRKIYVKTKEANSLKVEYVELFGENMEGDSVSEKIYPD